MNLKNGTTDLDNNRKIVVVHKFPQVVYHKTLSSIISESLNKECSLAHRVGRKSANTIRKLKYTTVILKRAELAIRA